MAPTLRVTRVTRVMRHMFSIIIIIVISVYYDRDDNAFRMHSGMTVLQRDVRYAVIFLAKKTKIQNVLINVSQWSLLTALHPSPHGNLSLGFWRNCDTSTSHLLQHASLQTCHKPRREQTSCCRETVYARRGRK